MRSILLAYYLIFYNSINVHNNKLYFKQVQEGIELAAYESIPGNQRVDLHQILRSEFPFEVVDNLQKQIDTIGRN